MALSWLGKYESFIASLMHYGNAYAQNYNTERDLGLSASFSASEIQALEYIMLNEDKNENMASLAAHMGIPSSTFSKNISKMVKKGLLEKYRISTNRKEVIVRVSDLGRTVYEQYSRYAMEHLYSDVFARLDNIPEEYIAKFTEVLELCASANRQTSEPTLIKIE